MTSTMYGFDLRVTLPGLEDFPRAPGGLLVRAGMSPAYAMQLAVLAGAKAVGILGVDYSAPDLKRAGRASHFYGDGRAVRSSGGGGWTRRLEVFHTGFQEWARARGCEVYNLSPFADTPINQAGWPRLSVEAFARLWCGCSCAETTMRLGIADRRRDGDEAG